MNVLLHLHWLCDLSIPTHAHMDRLRFTQPSGQRLAQPNVIWYHLAVAKVQITPYGDIFRKKDTSLCKLSDYPLSVERRLVVVNVLHHDLQEARGLLGRRSQVGGGEDQRVLVPLFPVQPNLKWA